MNKDILSARNLAKLCAITAVEKIAQAVLIIDLTKIETAPSFYFVICSCDSDVQMRAIVDEMEKKSKEYGYPKPRIEGINSTSWILVDFFDVVVHIMHYEARRFYNLEKLWGDGAFYKIGESGKLTLVRNKTKFLLEFHLTEVN
ncbi:MAG: ribosome silencing factor [Ignavibacteria bacterium]|nr:ribosome silencing factor [Ignavibacteria bacterium]